MKKDEIMNVEAINTNEVMVLDKPLEVIEYEEGSGVGKGVLIGACLVGAGFALYKLGKKAVLAIKAKKQSKEDESNVDNMYDEDVEDSSEINY